MFLIFSKDENTWLPMLNVRAHYFDTLGDALAFTSPPGQEISNIIKIDFSRNITWPQHKIKYAQTLEAAYIPQVGDSLMTSSGCMTIDEIDYSKKNPYRSGRNWYSDVQVQHMSLLGRKPQKFPGGCIE